MSRPIVYFTKEITPANVIKMYEAVGKHCEGKVACKVHSGEKGNLNFIRPEFWKPMVEHVNGKICEANTAYDGARNTTAKHWDLMKYHKWTEVFPDKVDIIDEAESFDLNLKLPIPGKNIFFIFKMDSKLKKIMLERVLKPMIQC